MVLCPTTTMSLALGFHTNSNRSIGLFGSMEEVYSLNVITVEPPSQDSFMIDQ